MKRLMTPIAAALIGLGCADEGAVKHPGPLMARAPAPVVAPVAASVAAVPSVAPLSASPAPAMPSVASPAKVMVTAEGTTGGSRASAPGEAVCQPGRVGPPADAPWSGGPDYKGTGHPDPEPLRKVPDAEMLALAADLGRGDPDRQHALVSIGRRHLPGAMAVFAQSIEASQPKPIREMALSGLMEHGGPEALPLMKRVLDDPSAHLRGMAIWGVALYGASEAHGAILRGLEDPDPGVQGMAVLAVWALRDRLELAMPILEAAALAEERRVWQEAFNVLVRIPSSDAVNLLALHGRTAKGEKAEAAVWSERQWRRRFPELCR